MRPASQAYAETSPPDPREASPSPLPCVLACLLVFSPASLLLAYLLVCPHVSSFLVSCSHDCLSACLPCRACLPLSSAYLISPAPLQNSMRKQSIREMGKRSKGRKARKACLLRHVPPQACAKEQIKHGNIGHAPNVTSQPAAYLTSHLPNHPPTQFRVSNPPWLQGTFD